MSVWEGLSEELKEQLKAHRSELLQIGKDELLVAAVSYGHPEVKDSGPGYWDDYWSGIEGLVGLTEELKEQKARRARALKIVAEIGLALLLKIITSVAIK